VAAFCFACVKRHDWNRLCEAQAHGPQGRGYSLEAFSQSDVRSTILDVGRRFAVVVFKGAIPENAVPADDFAKG